METHSDNYQSYLLRLWRESEQAPWRASLQSAVTEQTFRFATVEALIAFLMAQIDGTHKPVNNTPSVAP